MAKSCLFLEYFEHRGLLILSFSFRSFQVAAWVADILYWSAGSSSSSSAFSQLPANAFWEQRKMAHVLGALPLTWGVWIELWAPGFDLAQPQPLCTFGE